MEHKTTQREMVITQLKDNGYVSRNWCLQNYITRLGAIICDLKKEGWDFTADYHKYEYGKDYRYFPTKFPDKIQWQIDNQLSIF